MVGETLGGADLSSGCGLGSSQSACCRRRATTGTCDKCSTASINGCDARSANTPIHRAWFGCCDDFAVYQPPPRVFSLEAAPDTSG